MSRLNSLKGVLLLVFFHHQSPYLPPATLPCCFPHPPAHQGVVPVATRRGHLLWSKLLLLPSSLATGRPTRRHGSIPRAHRCAERRGRRPESPTSSVGILLCRDRTPAREVEGTDLARRAPPPAAPTRQPHSPLTRPRLHGLVETYSRKYVFASRKCKQLQFWAALRFHFTESVFP